MEGGRTSHVPSKKIRRSRSPIPRRCATRRLSATRILVFDGRGASYIPPLAMGVCGRCDLGYTAPNGTSRTRSGTNEPTTSPLCTLPPYTRIRNASPFAPRLLQHGAQCRPNQLGNGQQRGEFRLARDGARRLVAHPGHSSKPSRDGAVHFSRSDVRGELLFPLRQHATAQRTRATLKLRSRRCVCCRTLAGAGFGRRLYRQNQRRYCGRTAHTGHLAHREFRPSAGFWT